MQSEGGAMQGLFEGLGYRDPCGELQHMWPYFWPWERSADLRVLHTLESPSGFLKFRGWRNSWHVVCVRFLIVLLYESWVMTASC